MGLRSWLAGLIERSQPWYASDRWAKRREDQVFKLVEDAEHAVRVRSYQEAWYQHVETGEMRSREIPRTSQYSPAGYWCKWYPRDERDEWPGFVEEAMEAAPEPYRPDEVPFAWITGSPEGTFVPNSPPSEQEGDE